MKIGKLQLVPLREVWKKEQFDFSKWMSENLESLSDALDFNLELIETEKKVDDSDYSIDILCTNDEGQTVIIENQLEKSDHKHLGQILTYTINMNAAVAVWITKETRQEHINVVNWLNEFSDKRFYLIKIEAYKIDNSDPAPFFSVICRPTEESKKIGTNKKEIHEDLEERNLRKSLANTIVVPARKEGFEEVFLGENSWYSIRIKESKIQELQYIACYQVAPTSAITHVAKIKEIIPCEKIQGKYRVNFESKATPIKPIPLGKISRIQSPVFCLYDKLETSKTIDDVLSSGGEVKKAS